MASSRPTKIRLVKGSSSSQQNHDPITALSLLSNDLLDSYSNNFSKIKIVKQFVVYKQTLGRLNLPHVVELLRFQKLGVFLECDTAYNEELIKMFYNGLQGNF